MKLRLKYTERFVATFLIIAFIIIAGSIALILINKKVFESKYSYKAVFADAIGLSANRPVFFKGFNIGRISNYILSEGNYVIAEFQVYAEFKEKIVFNSALYKSISPITSVSSIELLQGPNPNILLPEGATIFSIDVPEGRELLTTGFVQMPTDPLSAIILNLETFTDNLNRDSTTEEGAVLRFLVNLADASESINRISNQLENDISRISTDRGGSSSLYSIMNNLSDVSNDLSKAAVSLNKVLNNIDTLVIAYKEPDSLLYKMLDPTGESIYNPLNNSLNSLNNALLQIETFITFLNTQSSEVSLSLSELRSILRQLNMTVESINNSPLIGVKKVDRPLLPIPGTQTRIKNLEDE